LCVAASQAAKKTQNTVIPFTVNVHGEPRHVFFAGESLFSWVSIEEGFLAEFIPVPIGTRNDERCDFFRNLFSRDIQRPEKHGL
jgi:hypothetical protein